MQENKSSVSVVIPATGNCEYLALCLESIEKSNHKPYEVIVVDDGISKYAQEVLYSFASRINLRIVKNIGEGLVDALNTGIHKSVGEFIARIDSDDKVMPHRFETQIQVLNENEDISVVGSNLYYIDTLGNITGKSNYPIGFLNDNPEFKTKCLIAHPSTMFRRQDALDVGCYRKIFKWKNIQVAEDFDLWLRLKSKGQILILDQPLIEYRQHESQLSSKKIREQYIGTLFIAARHELGDEYKYKLVIENNYSYKIIILLGVIWKGLGVKYFFKSLIQFLYIIINK